MSKKRFKQILALIALTILLLFLKDNFNFVWDAMGLVITVSMPFIIGICIAFMINKPYVFFSNTAFKVMDKSKSKFVRSARKPVSLILAYLLVLGIVAFLIGILIPELLKSFETLVNNFSSYADAFKNWIITVSKDYFNIEITEDSNLFSVINNLVNIMTNGETQQIIDDLSNSYGTDVIQIITGTASVVGPNLFDTAMQFTTGLYNTVMGLVVSFYYLACKEKLIYQTKKLVVAVMPENALHKTFDIAELSNRMFGRYIYGRIIDSAIMGILCFIGMSIFRFDYPLLISVVVGITNVIPMFGPFIGAIPSILLLLIVNPIEALWFALFIFILQQIDGNVIGPKVVGDSIGISGFWIMASVIIGGGLFSVVGMFIAVPVFAIIYSLIRDAVNNKIKEKNYLQHLGDSPDSDIITDAEKPAIDFKETKLFKTIKDNVIVASKKNPDKSDKN